MKKIVFLFVLSLACTISFGQNYSKLASVNFEDDAGYKAAETQVLECANYLLSNPVDFDKFNRKNAFTYIFKWMEGTSDYTFAVDEKAMKLTDDSSELLTLFFTSMTKAVLENPNTKLTDMQIFETAQGYLADYCANSANNQKPSKALKKVIKKRK